MYHSVLFIPFAGELQKGYLESLVIGDTRCGKTKVCEKYLAHYRLGAFAGGEQANFAGLIGGLEQVHNRWSVNWGKIPLNDRRILLIDEMAGMDAEVIAALSQIRSSGVAEIIKIRTARTNARTRLAWFSNPRKNQSINSFSTGPEIVMNLIKQPEDVARFDFALIIAFDDVDSDVINAPYRDEVKHVYTKDLCRDLILWAWSRKPEDVYIEKKAYEACFTLAKELYTKYSHACPLVNPSEQKIKLARMATSLACRLFSTDDGVKVKVIPEHVEYIYAWLNKIYDSKYFMYDEWSKDHNPSKSLVSDTEVNEVLGIMGYNAVRALLNRKQITVKDFEELLNCERSEAKTYVSKLLKNNAITKYYSAYVKTPAFIAIIKAFMKQPQPATTEDY